jgi:predicted O-methyltransferase YrrM
VIKSMIKNRINLAEYLNELGFRVGLEVGTAGGRFAETLCSKIPGLKYYGVDTWKFNADDPFSATDEIQKGGAIRAKKVLANFDATLIKKKSLDAVKVFKDETLDFVYIDGNHSFDFVMQDIIQWTHKVKKGGIIAGHDYSREKRGVILAVDAYTSAHKLKLNIIDYDPNSPRFNRNPNWWFVRR